MSVNIIDPNLNFSGNFTSRQKTDYITLHHAEWSKCTVQDIHGTHKAKGWIGIGYHFFVRKDGKIYRGRPMWAVGAHVQGMNNCSIGICAEGAYMTENMPSEQKKAIAELIDYIKTNYYPNAKIVGHREIGSSDCPGKNFPLEELKNYKSILGGKTMAGFKDTKGHYAEAHINKLKDMGIVNGCGDCNNGNFHPDDKITRADAAIMVANVVRYFTGK